MKKLLTLCLALAMAIATGAFALNTLGSTKVHAEESTASQETNELTVKATEVYTFTDGSETHTADTTPAIAAWRDVMGMTKFVNGMKDDAKTYIGFDEVDVSNYAFLNFKAWYWQEGGKGLVGSYALTDVYTKDNEDSGYDVSIFKSWANGDCNIYTESSLYVSIPTSKLKDADGKVSGLIIKNSDGCGWFMLGDFIFSNYCYSRIDTVNSHSVSGDATYGVTLQSKADESYSKLWMSEELLYRSSIAAHADFTATFKFLVPFDASEVDYLHFKILGWEDKKYAEVTLKNLDGTTVKTLDVYYAWDTTGELNCYLPVDGLKNENGLIEGFILDAPAATNLLFTDVTGHKGSPQPVANMLESNSTAGYFQKGEWAAIQPTISEGLLFNGRNIENGTINVVFKMPVKASIYKTIDFKALIWNGKDVKNVVISKTDGTAVETIKMKSGTTAEEYGDLNVKVNAELLADENGLVDGFSMTFENNAQGHVVFSAFTGGTEEKSYSVTFKAGSDDITQTYTASTKDSVAAPEVPAKAHYTGAWEAFELNFTEGQVVNAVYTPIEYNVTFKNGEDVVSVQKYTVENKNITVPEVPAKAHYTGAWAAYELNGGDVTVNATYVPTEYNVTFKNGEEVVSAQKYTIENKNITVPEVPAKAHYTGAWESYELNGGDVTVNAIYVPNTYTVTFKNGEEVVATQMYTVENKKITVPEVPAKTHYTGTWAAYELNGGDVIVNAVYTAIEYTVTFKAEGKVVSAVKYTIVNKDSVTAPEVPAKAHYTGAWAAYELAFNNEQVVEARYTAIEYTITYKADGEVVATVTYTEETKDSVTAPEVPAKEGFEGAWAAYELAFDNAQVVEAEYTEIPATGCTSSVNGLGFAFAGLVMAIVALKKKRG